jgi:spore coat polysaccharide biosynthesis predicted glycosyltransferase SpsG
VDGNGRFPHNLTSRAIQALNQIETKDLQVIVVTGVNNPHQETLELLVQDTSFQIYLKRNVNKMSDLMAWADVAISAGGSTCWEIAYMGLPSIVIVAAENQQGIAEGLAQAGSVLNLGWFQDLTDNSLARELFSLLGDRTTRSALCKSGSELVDGSGAARLIRHMLETVDEGSSAGAKSIALDSHP